MTSDNQPVGAGKTKKYICTLTKLTGKNQATWLTYRERWFKWVTAIRINLIIFEFANLWLDALNEGQVYPWVHRWKLILLVHIYTTPPVQQNCHSDNFLDQLRAFPPPFGQSPSGLPITQDFCLEKLIRNNGPFLDTSFHEKIFLVLFMKRVTVRTFSKGMKQNRHEFFTLWVFLRCPSRNFQMKLISFTLSFCREIDSQPMRLKTYWYISHLKTYPIDK